jgi:hypothetical protein
VHPGEKLVAIISGKLREVAGNPGVVIAKKFTLRPELGAEGQAND